MPLITNIGSYCVRLIPKNDVPVTNSGVYYITAPLKDKILGPADMGATSISSTPTIYPVVYKLDSIPATPAGPFSVTLPHHTAINSADHFKISLLRATSNGDSSTDPAIPNPMYDPNSANKRYLQFGATLNGEVGDATFSSISRDPNNKSYSGAIFDLTTSGGVALSTVATGANPLTHKPEDLTYISSDILINDGKLLSYNESGLTAPATSGTKYTFQVTDPPPVGINIRYTVFDNQHKGFFQLVNTDSTGLYTWLCYNPKSQASTLSSSTSLSTSGGVYTVTDLNDCVDGLGGANDSYWAYAVDSNNKLIVYADVSGTTGRQYLLTNKSFPSQTSSSATGTGTYPNGTPGAFPFLGNYRPIAFTALDYTTDTSGAMTIDYINLNSATIILYNVKVVESLYTASSSPGYSNKLTTYATVTFNLDGTFLTGNTNPQILLSNASPQSGDFANKYRGITFTFKCELENGVITFTTTGTTLGPSPSSPVATASINSGISINNAQSFFYTTQTPPFSSPLLSSPPSSSAAIPSCTSGLIQSYPTYSVLPTKIAGFNFVDQTFAYTTPMTVTYGVTVYTAKFVPVSVSESSYTNSTLQSLIFSAVDVSSYTDLDKGTQMVQSLAVVVKDIVNTTKLVFNNYNQYQAHTHWLFKVSQNAANAVNQSKADTNNPYFVWVIGQSTSPSTYFFVTHVGSVLTLQKILNILPGAGTRQVIDIIQQYLFTYAPKPTAADPSAFTKWNLLWKFRDDDHLIDGSKASGNEILIATADDGYYVSYTSATTNAELALTSGRGPASPSSTNPGSPGLPGTILPSSPPYKTTTNTSRLYCYYTFAATEKEPSKDYSDVITTTTNAAGSTVVIEGGAGLIPAMDPLNTFIVSSVIPSSPSSPSSPNIVTTISNPTMSNNGPQFTLTTFTSTGTATAPTAKQEITYLITDTGDTTFSYNSSSSPGPSPSATNLLGSGGTGRYTGSYGSLDLKITPTGGTEITIPQSLVSMMGSKLYTVSIDNEKPYSETLKVSSTSVTQPQLTYTYNITGQSSPIITTTIYITETGSSTFKYYVLSVPTGIPANTFLDGGRLTSTGSYSKTTNGITIGFKLFA